MEEYTLLMQRSLEGSEVKDSLSDFGFATSEIAWPTEETEEVSTRVWPGEHGEDAYIPPTGLKLKAYDLEVEFIFKSSVFSLQSSELGAYGAYKEFRDWLIGGELKIYDPYWKKGRKGVYVKKFSDLKPFRTNVDEGVSVKVTFRVTDPGTEVSLMMNDEL